MSAIIGIDLGTTNSAIATLVDKLPSIIKTRQGKTTVPSVVHYPSDREHIVGDKAFGLLSKHPYNTIYAIKRIIGKKYTEISKSVLSSFPFKLTCSSNDEPVVDLPNKKQVKLKQVSADILNKLKGVAEKGIKKEISDVVITVPAYFNSDQRNEIHKAAKLAGLKVIRMINEPTAAALSYGLDSLHLGNKKKEQIIAVYDLGGGTFDFSVLRIENGIFEVLATSGDCFLGGEDFDHILKTFMIQKLGLTESKLTTQQQSELKRLSETVKRKLSENDSCVFEFEDKSVTISRNEFEKLISPLINKTVKISKMALEESEAKFGTDQKLDKILLVGGSTRVPLVSKSLTKHFNITPSREVNPDEAVALGAAIQAGILKGQFEDVLLLDVIPLSLGIETLGGVFTPIIKNNSTLPIEVSEIFTTAVDGQKDILIKVAQGESPVFNNNKYLGKFRLSNLAPLSKGQQKITVKFKVDSNGVLKVYGESDRVEKMIEINESELLMTEKEAASYNKRFRDKKEEDTKTANFMELKQNCEIAIHEIESLLRNLNSKKIGKLKEINMRNKIKEIKRMTEKDNQVCIVKLNKKLDEIKLLKDKILMNSVN